jgi:hypothetical protein
MIQTTYGRDLYCDGAGCHSVVSGGTVSLDKGGQRQIQEMRQYAREKGWYRLRTDRGRMVDLCPTCIATINGLKP